MFTIRTGAILAQADQRLPGRDLPLLDTRRAGAPRHPHWLVEWRRSEALPRWRLLSGGGRLRALLLIALPCNRVGAGPLGCYPPMDGFDDWHLLDKPVPGLEWCRADPGLEADYRRGDLHVLAIAADGLLLGCGAFWRCCPATSSP